MKIDFQIWTFQNTKVQWNLEFTYLDFTSDLEFTFKSLMTKLRIYYITCLNSTVHLDFKLQVVLQYRKIGTWLYFNVSNGRN